MVDFDNLIDYMLINQYATNHDGPSNIAGYGSGNNMRLLRKREPGGKFRFYVWDMEYTFWNVNENSNINDVDFANTAGHLFTKLRENPEFRQRFADRAVMHLTGNGALTPAMRGGSLASPRGRDLYRDYRRIGAVGRLPPAHPAVHARCGVGGRVEPPQDAIFPAADRHFDRPLAGGRLVPRHAGPGVQPGWRDRSRRASTLK